MTRIRKPERAQLFDKTAAIALGKNSGERRQLAGIIAHDEGSAQRDFGPMIGFGRLPRPAGWQPAHPSKSIAQL